MRCCSWQLSKSGLEPLISALIAQLHVTGIVAQANGVQCYLATVILFFLSWWWVPTQAQTQRPCYCMYNKELARTFFMQQHALRDSLALTCFALTFHANCRCALFEPARIYDLFGELLSALNIFSLLLCLALYLKV